MGSDVFMKMEEELEKLKIDEDIDEIFFGMVESFLEGGESGIPRTYSEIVGKYTISLHGKVVTGDTEEEDCVLVEWLQIGDRVFEINDFFG